jgi:Zn-dependent protease
MDQREDSSRRPTARARGRRSGLRIGRLFGFPVYLSPSWLLLAALVTFAYGEQLTRSRPQLSGGAGYLLGAAFVLCLVGSVLLHELGHAVASRRLGTGVRGITLELLGGYTEMERDAPRPAVEAVVSLAGPVASCALAVAAAGTAWVLPGGTVAALFAGQLAVSNAIIAVFNALPGLPLDGGRATQALVWAVTGDPHLGRRVAGRCGQALALGCVLAGAGLYLTGLLSALGVVFAVLVAGSVWFGASAAVRLGWAGARLHLVEVDRLARPIFRVPAGMSLGEARRRAAGAGLAHAALGVVDAADELRALVNEAAADAVPVDRRDWVPVDDLARRVDPARALPAGLRGGDVLRAVEADPVGEYLVTAGEDVVGVLRVADVARALEPRTRAPEPRRSSR